MTTTAALLLFVAGVGLGYLVGFMVSWHRWSSRLQAEGAAHQHLEADCRDVSRHVPRATHRGPWTGE